MFTCSPPLTLAPILCLSLLLTGYLSTRWLLLGGYGQIPESPTEDPRSHRKPKKQASGHLFDDLSVASNSHFEQMQEEHRPDGGPAVTDCLPNVYKPEAEAEVEATDGMAAGRRRSLTAVL